VRATPWRRTDAPLRRPISAIREGRNTADGALRAGAYSWALEQARLLREGRWDEIDLGNVAEEIEGVARSEYHALQSHLARVIQHMLKWDDQEGRRARSWVGSIDVHRVRAGVRLGKRPGLKGELDELLADAYALAVAYARKDTGFSRAVFPERCPYNFETIMTRPFTWPDAPLATAALSSSLTSRERRRVTLPP
jgi:hypothetical protein